MLAAVRGLTPEQFTRDMGSSFPSVRDTLAHLYSAEWAWYQRWHGNVADGAICRLTSSGCRVVASDLDGARSEECGLS